MSSFWEMVAAFGTMWLFWRGAAGIVFAIAFWAELCLARKQLAAAMRMQLCWRDGWLQRMKRAFIDGFWWTFFIAGVVVWMGACLIGVIVLGLMWICSPGVRAWIREEYSASKNRIPHLLGW